MIFDTHAHYDSERFDGDREELLRSLPEKGVGLIVNPGCDGATSRKAVSMAERFSHLYAAVGWHPQEWENWTGESMAEIRALAASPRVVAIGEIGLDYYWDKDHKPLQKEMFERQLCLALELDLPVIVHDRDAHEDTLETVLRYPGLRGVFHCYSGSAQIAAELIRRGWYLGFDGPVTFKNNQKAPEVLAVTPLDRILAETDSPYLTPVPYRGKRNHSGHLHLVIEKLAEIKGVTAAEMERITWENGCRLFGLEG
jgi:TatD DNase family protein